MSLDTFLSAPWKTAHKAYEQSVFNIRPAPEFATAEVVVASMYRSCGFSGHAESSVPAAGRQFDKAASKARRREERSRISAETWRVVLHGALESPKQPKQSARRFLQLCPVVPDVALYSGSARLSGNSWDPGQLIQRMIHMGSASLPAAEAVWSELFLELSVEDDDDIWARWLQAEFEERRQGSIEWRSSSLASVPGFLDGDKASVAAPAVQFVKDLSATLQAKHHMTRRQWISLLEAVVRLGAVTHVLWLCDVNDRLWRKVKAVLEGSGLPTETELAMLIADSRAHLVYGQPALPMIRDLASRYLLSRLGLNLVLWKFESKGIPFTSLSSLYDVASLLRTVAERRAELEPLELLKSLGSLEDEEARTLACRKGIGSNLVEFCRYTLGQRQTADPNLRGYDQGYHLKKRGEYASAPWVVRLGPVALLAVVHCCLHGVSGPRSVHRLCEHLSRYGLQVEMDNVARGDLGRELRMLGLVLDSPDAESGMLLIPPFQSIESGTLEA